MMAPISIVNYFRHNGYNVKMDVMDSGDISSQGPSRWAESQIRKAKKVLVFLTPALVNLSTVDGMAESLQSQVTVCFKLFFLDVVVSFERFTQMDLMCSHNRPRFFADFQPNRRIWGHLKTNCRIKIPSKCIVSMIWTPNARKRWCT